MKNKYRKYLIPIGALGVLATPIVATISCSKDDKNNDTTQTTDTSTKIKNAASTNAEAYSLVKDIYALNSTLEDWTSIDVTQEKHDKGIITLLLQETIDNKSNLSSEVDNTILTTKQKDRLKATIASYDSEETAWHAINFINSSMAPNNMASGLLGIDKSKGIDETLKAWGYTGDTSRLLTEDEQSAALAKQFKEFLLGGAIDVQSIVKGIVAKFMGNDDRFDIAFLTLATTVDQATKTFHTGDFWALAATTMGGQTTFEYLINKEGWTLSDGTNVEIPTNAEAYSLVKDIYALNSTLEDWTSIDVTQEKHDKGIITLLLQATIDNKSNLSSEVDNTILTTKQKDRLKATIASYDSEETAWHAINFINSSMAPNNMASGLLGIDKSKGIDETLKAWGYIGDTSKLLTEDEQSAALAKQFKEFLLGGAIDVQSIVKGIVAKFMGNDDRFDIAFLTLATTVDQATKTFHTGDFWALAATTMGGQTTFEYLINKEGWTLSDGTNVEIPTNAEAYSLVKDIYALNSTLEDWTSIDVTQEKHDKGIITLLLQATIDNKSNLSSEVDNTILTTKQKDRLKATIASYDSEETAWHAINFINSSMAPNNIMIAVMGLDKSEGMDETLKAWGYTGDISALANNTEKNKALEPLFKKFLLEGKIDVQSIVNGIVEKFLGKNDIFNLDRLTSALAVDETAMTFQTKGFWSTAVKPMGGEETFIYLVGLEGWKLLDATGAIKTIDSTENIEKAQAYTLAKEIYALNSTTEDWVNNPTTYDKHNEGIITLLLQATMDNKSNLSSEVDNTILPTKQKDRLKATIASYDSEETAWHAINFINSSLNPVNISSTFLSIDMSEGMDETLKSWGYTGNLSELTTYIDQKNALEQLLKEFILEQKIDVQSIVKSLTDKFLGNTGLFDKNRLARTVTLDESTKTFKKGMLWVPSLNAMGGEETFLYLLNKGGWNEFGTVVITDNNYQAYTLAKEIYALNSTTEDWVNNPTTYDKHNEGIITLLLQSTIDNKSNLSSEVDNTILSEEQKGRLKATIASYDSEETAWHAFNFLNSSLNPTNINRALMGILESDGNNGFKWDKALKDWGYTGDISALQNIKEKQKALAQLFKEYILEGQINVESIVKGIVDKFSGRDNRFNMDNLNKAVIVDEANKTFRARNGWGQAVSATGGQTTFEYLINKEGWTLLGGF